MNKWVENKEVTFTCQRDIFEYLLDEKHAVKNILTSCPYHDMVVGFDDEGAIGNWSLSEPKYWKPMKRAEWYDDIPEKGVLCKDNFGSFIFINEYKNGWFIAKNGDMHKIAKPVTKEEVMQYILPD